MCIEGVRCEHSLGVKEHLCGLGGILYGGCVSLTHYSSASQYHLRGPSDMLRVEVSTDSFNEWVDKQPTLPGFNLEDVSSDTV